MSGLIRPGVNDYGGATCPMPVIDIDVDHDTQITTSTVFVCGADLYVDWSFTCPFGPDDVIEPEAVPKWAVSSSWQVSCSEGHTLASSQNGRNATDDAEPTDYGVLFDQRPAASRPAPSPETEGGPK